MAPRKTAEIKEICVSPLIEGYRLEAPKSTNPGRPGTLGQRTLSLPSPYVKVASDPGLIPQKSNRRQARYGHFVSARWWCCQLRRTLRVRGT